MPNTGPANLNPSPNANPNPNWGKSPLPSPNISNPLFIPYEDNTQNMTWENYPNRIKAFSPIYWCLNGDWRLGSPWTDNTLKGSVCLVEVWDERGGISIHPSRNPFHWVVDPEQKRIWHKKATGPLAKMMYALRHGEEVPEGVVMELGIARSSTSGKPTPNNPTGKSEDIPDWAMDAVNLFGYTSESDITWIFNPVINNHVSHNKNLALKALPSVYFKQGHLTADHTNLLNMGWDPALGEPPGKCLFFGNVLAEYVRPYVSDI